MCQKLASSNLRIPLKRFLVKFIDLRFHFINLDLVKNANWDAVLGKFFQYILSHALNVFKNVESFSK